MNKFPEARDLIWDEAVHVTKDTMELARGWIDHEFGKGYSKEHPELVAAFITGTMASYAGSIFAAAIQEQKKEG